jgi:formylglycine-generating enzyme required for sulfatase activity
VETISWNEAVSYCEAVGMRLPTEAEYEYAARSGGTGSRYGNLDRIAWYLDDSGHTTHEVGLKQSNALGFSDMLGNAEVWVSDWYAEYAAGSQRDPSGPASGQNRVVRGGSWATEARNARVSYRFRFGPSVRSNYVGIRCAGNAGGLPVVAPAPVAPRESVKPVLQAGTTKVNEKDGLLYVWIPPGTFQMGCSPGDSECLDNEKPAHEVTIAKGFWMGQVPVTQEAYQRVIGTNPSHFRGEQLPVESVTWNEAHSYCEVAGMRLPTEAEWEYAARAGTTGSRYGDLDRIAWFNRTTTHPVNQKEANAFRLYDMLGSVFEWVADWYADKYPPGPRRDPTGPVSGQARTQRGGSCLKLPRSARASTRSWSAPSTRAYDYGFRCAGN